jgi:hypothetical protein
MAVEHGSADGGAVARCLAARGCRATSFSPRRTTRSPLVSAAMRRWLSSSGRAALLRRRVGRARPEVDELIDPLEASAHARTNAVAVVQRGALDANRAHAVASQPRCVPRQRAIAALVAAARVDWDDLADLGRVARHREPPRIWCVAQRLGADVSARNPREDRADLAAAADDARAFGDGQRRGCGAADKELDRAVVRGGGAQ